MRTPSRNRLLYLLLLSAACSSVPVQYPLNPLARQILRPRDGHTGLTHRRVVYDPKGAETVEMLEYDLNDPKVRQELRALNFGCNVNGQLYRVAQDFPGLIRETYEQSCFLFICGERREVVLDTIPVSDYARILNAGTVCFSLNQYRFDKGNL